MERSSMGKIDIQVGLHYCVGNWENYRKALFVALKSIRGKLPILTGMAEWKEYDGFCTIAGILARICSHVGATEMAEWTERLELAALNQDYVRMEEELPGYNAELEILLTDLEETLRYLDKVPQAEYRIREVI